MYCYLSTRVPWSKTNTRVKIALKQTSCTDVKDLKLSMLHQNVARLTLRAQPEETADACSSTAVTHAVASWLENTVPWRAGDNCVIVAIFEGLCTL